MTDTDALKLAENLDHATRGFWWNDAPGANAVIQQFARAIISLTTDRDRFKVDAEAARAEAGMLMEGLRSLHAVVLGECRSLLEDESVDAVAIANAIESPAPLATAHLAEVAGLRAQQRTKGTVEVCERWPSILDLINEQEKKK